MSKSDILFKAIQKMREDDFSKEILIPLFYKIGYQFVDFHGGPYELGKDIVAHKENEFGQLEVTVIQSKKLKTEKTSASSKFFGDVVHQLRLCKTKKIACSDGKERTPTKILFITPFNINTRHLAEQFEAIQLDGITLIDQSGLNKLLEKYWPDVFNTAEDSLTQAIKIESDDITNLELYRALHIESKTCYADYYSDLNFFVGETESRKVFSSRIKTKKNNAISYEETEWQELKKANNWLTECTGIGIISEDIGSIEAVYNQKLSNHKQPANKAAIAEFENISLDIRNKQENLSKIIGQTKLDVFAAITSAASRTDDQSREHELSHYKSKISNIESLNRDSVGLKTIESEVKTIEALATENKRIKHQFLSISDLAKEIRSNIHKIEILEPTIIPHPKYATSLNDHGAAESLNTKIASLSQDLKRLNNRELTNLEVRTILDETNSVLRCIDGLTTKLKSTAIEFSLSKETSYNNELDISAHNIFDSGCNIAVYGEAGAGKSTTLYVYAEKLYKNKSVYEEVLFIPLNRITSKLGKATQDEKNSIIDPTSNFNSLINAFLLYKDIAVSAENRQWIIKALTEKNKVVIIIDALDESANEAGWIIPALSEIPQVLRNAQVITSSRNCVTFIKNIEFLGITLLPFNKEQLRRFIFGWLNDESQKQELWQSIQEKELFEVAKNPLLATIICTLHENGIPIPENEPDVYRRKIELLCGLYDQSKGIKRTKNERTFLETCCQKIAYRMHSRSQREASLDEIRTYLLEELESRVRIGVIDSVLDDLINICNVLIKSPDNSTYSFGHLRIQESLAAEELAKNRAIDIVSLITQSWWSGALFLYSFKNSIQPIIDEIYTKHGNFIKYRATLNIMISSQPPRLQNGLLTLLDRHAHADVHYGYDAYDRTDDDYHPALSLKDILGH